jgi:hypothetical protein
MCFARSQADSLDLPTGAGHFFIICRRSPQTAGMIPPKDIGRRFVHQDFTVSSPSEAKFIHHEQERKYSSAPDMTGLKEQNGSS